MIADVDDIIREGREEDILTLLCEYHRLFNPYWAGSFKEDGGKLHVFYSQKLVELVKEDYSRLCQKIKCDGR